jgi:hypothetical protein
LLGVAREHLLKPLPLLLAAALVGGGFLGVRSVSAIRSKTFRAAAEPLLLLGTAGVLLVQARYSFDHPGRFFNCLMPAHLALALLAGLALGSFRAAPRWLQLVLPVVLSFELYRLGYPPKRYVPRARDLQADAALESQLRKSGGTFVLPFRAYFGGSGVNQPHAHQMALWDLFAARLGDHEQRIRRDARRRFAKGRVTRVLLDEEDYVFFPELTRYFEKVSEEPIDARPGTTRTGAPMRSRFLYERKKR